MIKGMKQQPISRRLKMFGCSILTGLSMASSLCAEAPQASLAAFDKYVGKVESRLVRQHASASEFLAPADLARVQAGEPVIRKVPADPDPPGAMLHHWRGTAFAPGARPADFERLMRNFAVYRNVYAPQVVKAAVNSHDVDHYVATMRVVQKHVLTVVLDITYDETFARLDPRHGYSIARSTRIDEIDSPGRPNERALPPGEDHGFMWRLNTYWSYEERDGGLYLQLESVSLSRSIPTGLGWAVGPFVESVPRESLEFTLRKTCDALKK